MKKHMYHKGKKGLCFADGLKQTVLHYNIVQMEKFEKKKKRREGIRHSSVITEIIVCSLLGVL